MALLERELGGVEHRLHVIEATASTMPAQAPERGALDLERDALRVRRVDLLRALDDEAARLVRLREGGGPRPS